MARTFTISIPESYEDVYQWLQDLPTGERSRAVCQRLREGMMDHTVADRLDQILSILADLKANRVVAPQQEAREDRELDMNTVINLGGLLE